MYHGVKVRKALFIERACPGFWNFYFLITASAYLVLSDKSVISI